MPTTHETLTAQYGVLMDYNQLSAVLKRSPKAIRLTLAHSDSDWARSVNLARRKIGRRVLFMTSDIANIIDNGIA